MKKERREKKSLIMLTVLGVAAVGIIIVAGLFCVTALRLNQEAKEIRTVVKEEVEKRKAEEEAEKQAEQKRQEEAVNQALEEQETQPQAVESPEPTMAAPSIDTLAVGQGIDPAAIAGMETQYFKAYEIAEGDAVFNRINGKSYRANDNIGLADLRYLKMIHYNFEHQIQVGEMIVNTAVAEDVLKIFQELFAIEYEIQSMQLIDNYWTGDGGSSDSNSIDHNNSSAFCYREVTGGSSLSNHAYGRAIDLNPQQNPYVTYENGQPKWSHENASLYIDRSIDDPHVIKNGDACYNIFAKYGFSWGGDWSSIKDYQHFEREW